MCLLQSNMTYILTIIINVSPRYLPYNKKSSSTDAIIERFVMPAMVPDAKVPKKRINNVLITSQLHIYKSLCSLKEVTKPGIW